ncbi:protein translocase subunit secG [Methylobacillus rhizosphaerae]|uniref:Protein-export membrane protein SecG n=1 Tax=Methylobacillus rhizosphaerae TaxID=551994 RepID=A0A239AKI2_9PROT|nr:preprotein translocase subunit SecG [Methylobacillus rhizosphaerae]SNR96059.1 protein translocase subunit secG [Methylobacillus rhizosphaerae]
METIVTVIHVIAALGVVGLVLLQHGKGADMGAAFGSGASGSLFGVSGSSNFMSRATAVCVAIFFVTSMSLAYLTSHRSEQGSVVQKSVVKSAPVSNTPKADEPASAKDVPQ